MPLSSVSCQLLASSFRILEWGLRTFEHLPNLVLYFGLDLIDRSLQFLSSNASFCWLSFLYLQDHFRSFALKYSFSWLMETKLGSYYLDLWAFHLPFVKLDLVFNLVWIASKFIPLSVSQHRFNGLPLVLPLAWPRLAWALGSLMLDRTLNLHWSLIDKMFTAFSYTDWTRKLVVHLFSS